MPNIFVSPTSRGSATPPPAKRKNPFFEQAFSSYLFMPEGIRFETQEPGETIILLLRKHWINNLFWLVFTLILLIAPIFFLPAIFFTGIISFTVSSSLVTFLILIWYLLLLSYSLVEFLLWYFTVSIVTSERIIDIDFVNILQKKFAETRIDRIEDVTMRTGGFIKALFDVGDVFVQTAAKEAVFQFEAIPHPEKVVRTINKLMGKTEE